MRIENARLNHFRVWRALGWLMVTAIVVVTLIPPPDRIPTFAYSDKLAHFSAYGLLMLWFAQLYATRQARMWHAALFVAMGIALEFCQGALGYRSFEYADMLANALGVFGGGILAATGGFNFLPRLDRALASSRARS
ncbi:MAG: VanZ family protein [Burkholderiales bacterium]